MGWTIHHSFGWALHNRGSVGQVRRPVDASRASVHSLKRSRTQRTYIRHWAARVLCLIVLPVTIYIACFKMHFIILNRSGPGDAQMSSLFQAHLAGNDFANNPLEPVFGSKVTLKNMGYGGGLLHSHVQTYPVGSQQQQITCYVRD